MRYYYKRDADHSITTDGCLSSLFTFLFLGSIIVALFIYLGIYVLCAFVAVGIIIGLVCAIISIIKSIPEAISDAKMGGTYSQGNAKVPRLLLRFVGGLFKHSFHNTIEYSKNALDEAKTHRFFSFKKWMYLAVSLSSIVLGTIILLILVVAISIPLLFISLLLIWT